MTTRERNRRGREVAYFPTDAEAATGNGGAGESWPATITATNPDGTANLNVLEADGGFIAKTDVTQGERKGEYSLRNLGGIR